MKHVTVCQAKRDSLASCSKRSLVPTRMLKLSWCLRNIGPFATLRLIWSRIVRFSHTKRSRGIPGEQTGPMGSHQEILDLQPGELVEVKSEQEICETLDEHDRHRGLAWMPNMARFCGKEYKVYKRVSRVMLESNGQIRKVKNTVLLDGVMCENLYGCDRSCFHFWREAWLRRVESRVDRATQPGDSS